jgi:hypothetical protein
MRFRDPSSFNNAPLQSALKHHGRGDGGQHSQSEGWARRQTPSAWPASAHGHPEDDWGCKCVQL